MTYGAIGLAQRPRLNFRSSLQFRDYFVTERGGSFSLFAKMCVASHEIGKSRPLG